MGKSFKDITKIAQNISAKGFSEGDGKTSKRKLNKLNKRKSSSYLRYAVLDSGLVHQLIDKNKIYSVLRADGYNAKYLGKSEIRSATRAQKFRKINWRCSLIYHQFKNIMDAYDVDLDKCVIIEGCYRTNIHTIQRTMTPDNIGEFSKYPNKENISKLDDAARVVLRKLKMYYCNVTPTFDFVDDTEISINKKPGYRYEECFGLSNKGDALLHAYNLAKRRWQYIDDTDKEKLEHKDMFPGVYTIGARNKRDHTYEDGELAVSRAVHMPELHVELTSAPWNDILTERIVSEAKGPIYIGNSILEWDRLQGDIDSSEYVLEGDYKRFDSTLYLRMITCALAVKRCLFDIESESVDKHFIAMYDSLVIKDYYVIRGDVFRIYHGLPSGVKSTSILGSIINLISLVYNIGANRAKNFRFIVGGDDFLVACFSKYYVYSKIVDEFSKRCAKLGMRLKFLDKKHYNSQSIDGCPVFYKYCVYKGVPVVPNAAVLERVFMPWNKNYNSDQKLFKFLKDVMPSLGTPMSHLLLYYIFYQRMLYIRINKIVPLGKIVESHILLNDRMMYNKEKSKLKFYKRDDDEKECVVDFLLTFDQTDHCKIKFDYSIF